MSRPESSQNRPEAQSTSFVARHRWVPFVAPLVVFLIAGSFEPAPRDHTTSEPSGWFAISVDYAWYPAIYSVKIGLTVAAMMLAMRTYRQFPWKLSRWAVLVGVVGAVVWVGLTDLQRIFGWTFGSGERSAFNPLEEMADRPAWAYTFLAIRFVGLVLIVPVIEEFFLRGFLMRFVTEADWWKLPIGQVSMTAVVMGSVVPALMHPGEFIAALVWFTLVTWLMVGTRNIWDCVVAHALTNLLLGCYVLATGNWYLM